MIDLKQAKEQFPIGSIVRLNNDVLGYSWFLNDRDWEKEKDQREIKFMVLEVWDAGLDKGGVREYPVPIIMIRAKHINKNKDGAAYIPLFHIELVEGE